MKPNVYRTARGMLLCVLPLLVMACASAPPPLPPVVVPPPAIPALPSQARQPPVPAYCSPTCSDGWTRLVESLLPRATAAALPGKPASAPPTR